MCRLARPQMTCPETRMIELDMAHLPWTTNAYKLQKDPDNRYVPKFLDQVSKPLTGDRQDLKLPHAARQCRYLNVDRRNLTLRIKRPSFPSTLDVRSQVEDVCLKYAVIADKIMWCRDLSPQATRTQIHRNLVECNRQLESVFTRADIDNIDVIEFTKSDWDTYNIQLEITDRLEYDQHVFKPVVMFAGYEGTLQDVINKVTKKVEEQIVHRNGLVVETNDVLSACTQSQSNVQMVCSITSSKNSLRYMTSYMAKQKVSLSTTFALLASVRKDIVKPQYKSREPDSGSITRNAKHFLARVNNMLLSGRRDTVIVPATHYNKKVILDIWSVFLSK